MKKIFIALFLFITSSIFSQELLGEFQSSSSKVKNLFYKIDREGKRLALFTTDSKNIYGYYLNNEFKIEYKLQVGKHRKFNTILGCITDNNGSYTIYLSNNNRTKFKSITLSFKKKTSNSTEFTLLREYETFLQSIIFKNKFYLLSSSIIANNSYLYSFDSGEPKRNIINVNNISFISKIGTQINLPDLLVKKIKLKKINTTIPNSIRLTADKRKMYVGEENIVFTFDNNSDYTQILTVNLNDYETSYKKIQKPLKMVKRKKKISNSYLLDKHLFTIAVSKKNLEFNIIDIEKNLTIKSYKVQSEDSISFKNSNISTQTLNYKTVDGIKKTSEFIKYVRRHKNIGISAQKENNKYNVEIGNINGTNLSEPVFQGGVNGQRNGMSFKYHTYGVSGETSKTTNESYFFDPIQFSFDINSDSNSINLFKSVLDENFNQINLPTKKNIFEHIYKKLNFTSKNISFDTFTGHFKVYKGVIDIIFKKEGYYIYAFYDKKANNIKLLKFTK